MLFDDVFYPGNPGRRQQVATLQAQIRLSFLNFHSAWNGYVNILNPLIAKKDSTLTLKTLNCDIDNDCAQMCIDEINSVVNDTKTKMDKLVLDIGITKALPSLPADLDTDPEARHRLAMILTGVPDVAIAGFITWYVYNSIRLFVAFINLAGASVSALAEILGGALGGMILGAAGFVITDVILSAISGAVERKQLNDQIDALTDFENQVSDPIGQAALSVQGILQAAKDGVYKISNKYLLVWDADQNQYQIVTLSSSADPVQNGLSVALVRKDFTADCYNGEVTTTDLSTIGGSVYLVRSNGAISASVSISHGTPNTSYDFYLKCVRGLGSVVTNGDGAGSGVFQFGPGDVGPVFGFDMYPSGAPLGNKFQSVQAKLAAI